MSPANLFNKAIFILLLSITATQTSFGQIKVSTGPGSGETIQSNQWVVNDLVYKVTTNVETPFEKGVFAIVTEGNAPRKVPLFYNGNNEWIFRYSSASKGKHTFVLESEIDELNGKRGSFKIEANTKAGRHGGVVLNPKNPQRFFYEDDTHYFNLAFECDWLFALDYGQQEIPKTKHLLSVLNKNGFNQIVMNVYAYDVNWPKDKRLAQHPEHEYGGREDIFPFAGSNSKPDHSTLNIEYFKHLDKVISEMHDQEIVSHLMIYVWNKLVAWPEMNSKEDNRYYEYVIKRYQAFPNIVWDVSKEAVSPIAKAQGRSTRDYIAERIKRAKKLDGFNRLISVHDYGFCRNHSDLVDFISIQHWKQTLYQQMLETQKEFPKKPIFNIEHGGYEESPYVVFPGAYVNAEHCLRRNYMCLFAGTYTTYYWQGTSWNVVIHNPYETSEEFAKPKFEYFKHMKTLADSIHFENCKPMSQHNSSGYNLTNETEGIIALYVPKETHSASPNRQLTTNFDHSSATVQWFNTLTGEFTPEKKIEIKRLTFYDERPWRDEADAVMIVRKLKK